MRDRILVIGRDVTLRGRLARLLKGASYAVELAENVSHAGRHGLKTFALALIATDGLGPETQTLITELRTKASSLCSSAATATASNLIRTRSTPTTKPKFSRALTNRSVRSRHPTRQHWCFSSAGTDWILRAIV